MTIFVGIKRALNVIIAMDISGKFKVELLN